MPELILASGSPRRRALLADLGVVTRVLEPSVDEEILTGETPEAAVTRLAEAKAHDVRRRVGGTLRDAWILAADTVVALDDAILGKPEDDDAARAMLRRLRGRTHDVWTGVCLSAAGTPRVDAVKTRVRFRAFDERELEAYVATGEPRDKAGAYGIQGWGGLLTEGIDGSWSNVVGLPLERTAALFREAGRPLEAWRARAASRRRGDQAST